MFSPRYGVTVAGAGIDPRRSERILSFLLEEHLVAERDLHRAPRASLRTLLLAHTEPYLESLHQTAGLVPIVGYEPDDEEAHRLIEAQRYASGGTALAAQLAIERGRVVANLGGGFHHAGPAEGRGFCIFNDVAVAIHALRRDGFTGRVLVVDLDLHDGNGTRRIFAEDEDVFTFSIHNRSWDDLPAVASFSLELGSSVEDRTYLGAIRDHLPPIVDRFSPDLVFYVAGVDPAYDDRLGDWAITSEGLLARDRLMVDVTGAAERTPTVIVLSGGYGADAWRYSARFFGWWIAGRRIEPPATGQKTVSRLRRLVRSSTLEPSDEGTLFKLSEEDIMGSLGESPRRTRLLDYFSLHGLELVLEQSGIFDVLRAEGYLRPTLDLDLAHPLGQSLRVWGEPERENLLIETRVLTERRVLIGFEMLRIEWLLLQNPHARFPADRPALPGQTYPGLGLLREMMTLLSLIAEQTQLDGLLFVASHYHLAAKGERYLNFIDPDDRAWFQAVHEVVEKLPLAFASRGVDEGTLVVDEAGAPVTWRPLYMAVPLSEALAKQIGGSDFEAEAAELADRYRFRAV